MKQRRHWLGLIAIAAVVALATAPAGETFSGRVVGVTDGDTITVLRGNQPVRVRLEGIDCPERGQDFGTRARQATSALVYAKEVRVEVRDHDRYGRIVGRVFVGDTDVSLALVEQGLAWHYKKYSSEQALAEAEQRAREAGRGLWSRADAVPPWEFRHGGRGASSSAPSAGREARAAPGACIPADQCCKVCRKGQVCGDSCISATATCRQGRGCACDAAVVCP
jgi:micrococcal nuclease